MHSVAGATTFPEGLVDDCPLQLRAQLRYPEQVVKGPFIACSDSLPEQEVKVQVFFFLFFFSFLLFF